MKSRRGTPVARKLPQKQKEYFSRLPLQVTAVSALCGFDAAAGVHRLGSADASNSADLDANQRERYSLGGARQRHCFQPPGHGPGDSSNGRPNSKRGRTKRCFWSWGCLSRTPFLASLYANQVEIMDPLNQLPADPPRSAQTPSTSEIRPRTVLDSDMTRNVTLIVLVFYVLKRNPR